MFTRGFFGSTRGRIVALLRRRESTADEIASQLGVTTNAIRAQITEMEREGIVRRVAQRPGATRPSNVFGLSAEMEQLLSRAYIPLMTEFLHVFTTALPAADVERLMREAGRRLAREVTSRSLRSGSWSSRVRAASNLLNEELGALTHPERNGEYRIRGVSCPLSALTGKHPTVCLAVESFLSEAMGVSVRECCHRDGKPRCCFEIKRP
jgi:DeoR family suf operon transcriptional repressor